MHFAQSLAESLSLQGSTHRKPSLVVFGEAHLRRALDAGNGVILGTAHTAGWEAALLALERFSDASVLVAMRPEREGSARDFHAVAAISKTRQVVSVGDDPLSSLHLLQHLRKGGVVAMQMDRAPAGMKAFEVEAGRKTWMLPAGPFALAAASGAPIVLALAERTGFLSYNLRVCRKVCVDRSVDLGQVRAAEKVAREIARHVYAAPTQWFDFKPA
jgi:KDO2-lipid IV(A) lauroyltransferase